MATQQKQSARIYTVDRPLNQRIKMKIYRQAWVRNLLRPLFATPKDHKWVFILGCYNSGTTMLHDLLAEHPMCASLPTEGAALTSHLVRPEDFGWTRMWWKVQNEMMAFGEGGGRCAETVMKDWALMYDTRRPIFLEKSVSNVVRIPWLAKNFPEAHFISIVRNGYAVAAGIQRKTMKSPYPLPANLKQYPIEWCAQQWVVSNEVMERSLSKLPIDRVFTLTYEDFCSRPNYWLSEIGNSLKIDGFANQDTSHILNMNTQVIGKLQKSDIKIINEVAGTMLMQYGYTLIQ